MVDIKKIEYADNLRQGTDKINHNFEQVVDEIETVDERVDTIISGGGPDKDPELVDIRNPDPEYTPDGTITTAGGMTRSMQRSILGVADDLAAHKAETAGWRNYNSLIQLGITEGSETMEQICAAMANLSELRYIKTSSNASSAYPANSGMLFVRRYASFRVELRFFRGSSNGVADEWIGYYDVNVNPTFTGWQKVAKDSDIINYETGTWTPELRFGGDDSGITYNWNNGRYTRIGNIVNWELDISLSSKGSSSGEATIDGLPFPSVNATPTSSTIGAASSMTLPSNVTGVSFFIASNSTSIVLRQIGNGISLAAAFSNSHFDNGTFLRASGKYTI